MPTSLKRKWWQRLAGIPASPLLSQKSWRWDGEVLAVDLSLCPELLAPGTGARIEGKELPARVLVVHGDDDEYHAFINVCTHSGRRLDPIPNTGTVQCCSFGRSTYNYEGEPLPSACARHPIDRIPCARSDSVLRIGPLSSQAKPR